MAAFFKRKKETAKEAPFGKGEEINAEHEGAAPKEEAAKNAAANATANAVADSAASEKKQEAPKTIVCPSCGREISKKEAEKHKYVCYECGNYFRVRTKNRIKMVADAKTFEPWFEDLAEENPLDFPGYPEKLEAAREKTGLHEAVTVGRCKIYGEDAVLGICDARFLMSSLGHVV